MISTYAVASFVLLILTGWIIAFRYTSRTTDSNWPLIYYALVVVHLQVFEEGLNRNVVFLAVAAAMTLRFEFMSGFFLKLIEAVEYGCLGYVAYRCIAMGMGWA